MIPLSTMPRVVVVLFVFSSAAPQSFDSCFAQEQKEERDAFRLSTVYVPAPGSSAGRTFNITVEWKGRRYGTSEGIDVLMRVIGDGRTDPDERAKALQKLTTLWPWLRNTDRIPELVALYNTLTGREERRRLIACLAWSDDERALPLFARYLAEATDDESRYVGASALARWDISRGVGELINLMDSRESAPWGRTWGETALHRLVELSQVNGSGFSDEEIRRSIERRTDLSDDDKGASYIAEMKAAVKKWFAENEHRFPDWKPGDPLPAAEPPPAIPPIPGPEDVLPLSAASLQSPACGRVGKDQACWRVGQGKEEEVSWQGKRYPAREGVDLLMKVVLEPGSVEDRSPALQRLEGIAGQLRDTERIPQLMELYGRVTDRSEKVGLLLCLAESKDQRAIPLFAEILDTRQEDYLRLPAAYGLALWNVRRGVRELIELLSVKQTETPIRPPGIIGDEAAHFLYRVNYWKSWWAPEAPLLAVPGARTEVRDEALDSCHAELKKWFAENEQRFPDWKLGDALPSAPANEKSESNGKKP